MTPKTGKQQEVVDLFERRRILPRSMAMPGCLAVELCVADGPDGVIVATGLWASRKAYDGWLETDGRADDVVELMTLLIDGPDALSPSLICEVVQSASASD